jgi:hypothetical protein
MPTPANFDPERPLPWQPGGYAQTERMVSQQRTGMARWGPQQRCQHCHESLAKKHGLTPQGNSLGWLLRGFGPFCYPCNLDAWDAWKKGMFHGKTEQNGF